jgi:hypothetical protein
MRLILLALMLALAAGPVVAAPYGTLMRTRVIFDGLAPARRDRLELVLRMLHHDKADASPVHLYVDDAGKHVPLTVDESGTLPAVVNPDYLARDVPVLSDPPHLALDMDISLHIVTPPGPAVKMVDLQAGVAQAQDVFRAGARAMGGMLAVLAAPSVHGVAVKPVTCCDVVARLEAGSRSMTVAEGKDGLIRISNAALADFTAGTLRLTAPISWIDTDTD